MPKASKPVTLKDFRPIKPRASRNLSSNPGTVKAREWAHAQTGLGAGIHRDSGKVRVAKYRAMIKLKASPKYKKADAERRAELEDDIHAEFHERMAGEMKQVQQKWTNVNDLDYELKDEDGEDTPDDDESDRSDPDFEVPEAQCANEGVDHTYDAEGIPIVDSNLSSQFEEVMKKGRARAAKALDRLEAIGDVDEAPCSWPSSDCSDDEPMDEDDGSVSADESESAEDDEEDEDEDRWSEEEEEDEMDSDDEEDEDDMEV
jgi:hypothetical protein